MVLKLPARAKINLAINVLGKRPDGYHEVAMVMQSLELHDLLEFSPNSGEINLVAEGGNIPPGEDNLVYRAAKLFRSHLGLTAGADIRLKKFIPVAAGLGGGSADAAAALAGLNMIWGAGLSLAELMSLGQELGADVPFCLLGGTALARGKGERLESLPPPPRLGVVLVKPPFGVSTASVYRAYKPAGAYGSGAEAGAMVKAIREKDIVGIAGNLANDLERVTISLHPVIAGIKSKLIEAGALGALMSGSGSTVFGLAPDLESARTVASRYKKADEQVLVTEFSSGLQDTCGNILTGLK